MRKLNGRITLLERPIGQLGFVVESIEQTMKNYHKHFGIEHWSMYTYDSKLLSFMNYYGKPARYSFKVALNNFGAMRIELIQPIEGSTIYADFIQEHGYGLQHLGIYVEDMQAALHEAKDAGLSVIMDGGGFGIDGDGHFAYLNTEKTCGICYELIQRPKRRHPPEHIYP